MPGVSSKENLALHERFNSHLPKYGTLWRNMIKTMKNELPSAMALTHHDLNSEQNLLTGESMKRIQVPNFLDAIETGKAVTIVGSINHEDTGCDVKGCLGDCADPIIDFDSVKVDGNRENESCVDDNASSGTDRNEKSNPDFSSSLSDSIGSIAFDLSQMILESDSDEEDTSNQEGLNLTYFEDDLKMEEESNEQLSSQDYEQNRSNTAFNDSLKREGNEKKEIEQMAKMSNNFIIQTIENQKKGQLNLSLPSTLACIEFGNLINGVEVTRNEGNMKTAKELEKTIINREQDVHEHQDIFEVEQNITGNMSNQQNTKENEVIDSINCNANVGTDYNNIEETNSSEIRENDFKISSVQKASFRENNHRDYDNEIDDEVRDNSSLHSTNKSMESKSTSEEEWNDESDGSSQSSSNCSKVAPTRRVSFSVIIVSDDELSYYDDLDDESSHTGVELSESEEEIEEEEFELAASIESSEVNEKQFDANGTFNNSPGTIVDDVHSKLAISISDESDSYKHAKTIIKSKRIKHVKTSPINVFGSKSKNTSLTSASFNRQREKLSTQLFNEFNNQAFNNDLSSVPVTWSNRLLTTAGITRLKRRGQIKSASIELSVKVSMI